MPRAFAFDLDETLVDAGWHHEYATRKMFVDTGVDPETVRHVFEDVTGLRTRDIVESFRLAAKLEDPLDDLLAARTRAFREATEEREVVLLPGARDLLMQARELGPVALVTSGHVGDALAVLESLDIKHWFTTIITGEDVDRPKPDPEPYEMAARHLEVATRDVIVFEDSGKGVEAALAAGCRVVAVPKQTTPRALVAKAHAVLGSMEEALPLRAFLERL
jgi:HAD superfamily hydrolase (TIGR01509 family)